MPNAKLSQLKAGDTVVVDNGFTCMPPGHTILHGDENGLFIWCNKGRHYISGQAYSHDGDSLVGIFLPED